MSEQMRPRESGPLGIAGAEGFRHHTRLFKKNLTRNTTYGGIELTPCKRGVTRSNPGVFFF